MFRERENKHFPPIVMTVTIIRLFHLLLKATKTLNKLE